jgi:ribonucleoside-triphosphate reductase
MKDVAKEFESEILPKEFLQKYITKKVPWGFNGLGYIVYKRTYSRIKENGQGEEWWETIARCINGAQKIGAKYTKDEAQRLYDLIFNLKCTFPGRMLWQLGTSTVDKFGANSLVNCWMIVMNEPKAFEFLFENLMLGGGLGYSIRREHIHELPKIKKDVKITHLNTKDADLIVPDSRQGWVRLLHYVLKSFFENGKSFSYSTILVRGAGELIKGFGGTASGPQILIEGMEKICSIFISREGKKLRSIDVLDICNIIGSVVVSGNVRRSAQISLGDPDDYLFLRAKRWDLGNVPNWRAMSNNTIYADDFDHITNDIWEGYSGNGEPYGFFNLPLSQKFGRIGEKIDDSSVVGLNPCAEVPLANYECCNLAELYLNNIESKEELIDCAKLLYKTQKAVSAMNYIHFETNEIVHKNMRLGLGITGVCQSLDKIEWLDNCYKELRKLDKEWSKQQGFPESIKLTTLKPSGSVSLLAGSTPGIHPAYSDFYIRRVRMGSSDKLASLCRELGYKVEYVRNFDGTDSRDTVIVEFPCKCEDAIISKDMSAIRQLDLVKKLQKTWADNAISVTVYYKKEELPEIKLWLKENYKDNIKSVSFLLHAEHGFKQAPYSEITKDEYNKLISKIKPFTRDVDSGKEILEGLECSGGSCPIR